MPNCDKSNAKSAYFDQYSLKIENNKAVIDKQGTYKGDGAGGAFCSH